MTKIKGFEDLSRKLKAIPQKLQGEVLAKATFAGARVIRKAAVANASSISPKGAKSIDAQVTKKSQKRAVASVGVRGGRTDGFFLNFFELGVSTRETKGTGPKQFKSASRGSLSARPWLRPAFDTTHDDATREIGRRLRIEIDKVARG